MPCLNEAETLATCIKKAQWYLQEYQVKGEVVIADNGSTDKSQEIALEMGARLVKVKEKGYGSALMGGIIAAKGEYIIMADADDSYDFTGLNPFLEKLRGGYDLVMGNRFKGGIKEGAMPFLHKYLGNPVLTRLGKLFFKSPCNDFHCGLRGFRKQAILNLNLRTTGMEFASEMVVKSTLNGLKITEVPTTLSPDGRSRKPHLRTWRDGWRHLRFLLLYSPRWLFLYPGFFLMLMGLVATIVLLASPRVHSLLYSATAIIIGFQLVNFAIFTKVYAMQEGLLPPDKKLFKLLDRFTLEQGLILGIILFILGGITSIFALFQWEATGFGLLNPVLTMRLVIPSVTSIALGLQIIFSSFFLSVFQLKIKQ
ncbi:glycosyltransferase family 2 protein [Geminocystis sp. NIES-3709]|uniref:glycosyltransferase family 2 protein n=1 Tax=Geminocystis sp. NIES-3709 TaxID=1617448 RepID=UPI0005FC4B86|nr:glycosyltransferase family 2 protein [Geminocystis sp. NIES-3709]BAQ64425.1 dolichol-p-glucose synthetase [Geminocystis sp. NIES-3709]